MYIKKVFNNNTVLVGDHKGLERIVLGRGIAFGKKTGQVIDERQIEKVFVVDSSETRERFVQLLDEVPVNHLELVNKVLKQAEQELHCQFSELTYIGLTDHINYALHRFREGHLVKNALLWEIKKFYPQEFQAAVSALALINYDENIQLPEDEAGFIALHFVNGQQKEAMDQTVLTTEIIQKVSLLLEDALGIQLDEDSLNYMRFVTHLRFFIQRITSQKARLKEVPPMYEQVQTFYPQAAEAVALVTGYLQEKLACEVYPEEEMYLILHVQRLMK
ncbi:transcription antiterminator [Enterococcus canis]|uniref:Transcription antiterminator n=1 Tax=Enterococcus canis TaxID=214095 RepID=A0A1L8RKN8_9ENTE|nr:PRD domain-containing protein [Enterococcus canis]OJG20326.1 transcription antiterminator [Enterococcus canis]